MTIGSKNTYFLGLGSNTNRIANINSCINVLRNSFYGIKTSPIYQSPAYGFDGHDFYNLAVKIKTVYTPHELKHWLKDLEDSHGRDRSKPKYSNRTLDIDMLLCNDLIIDDGEIQIPRREILHRSYVLKPLQDIAPNLIHPVTQKRLTDIWQAFSCSDILKTVSLNYISTTS